MARNQSPDSCSTHGILGPYFKEPEAAEPRSGRGPAFEWTAVDALLNKRTDLFQAATANEE
jgi:hypothetical protein